MVGKPGANPAQYHLLRLGPSPQKSERQPLLSIASVEFEEAGWISESPRSTEEGIFILEKLAGGEIGTVGRC